MSEFCRTPLVLARRKLARNQMFTARCVPNMHLFGTFSAQNPSEIAPLWLPSRALFGPLTEPRKWLPRFRARGRSGEAG